jgi:uncharacterized protein YbjT (DUF2867 family)
LSKQNTLILVTGATGRQGGATARHLLADGWQVRAFVRDPASAAAQALARAGAQLVPGDMDNRASLDTAMRGVYGVFSVQPFGYEAEIRQGKNVADAAKAANVQHFVHTSVGGAEDQTRFRPNFSKWVIEQHIHALGLPATILRPAGFMDDMVGPAYGALDGIFRGAFKPDVPMHFIAVDDIGVFAALAFGDPVTYLGQTIELAGDALPAPQIAAAISRATGRDMRFIQIPIEDIRQQSEDFARVYEWFNEGRYRVDIPALRVLHSGLMDFDTWLERQGKAKYEGLLRARQA